MNWPRYVCAILEDHKGRFLLESRPNDAQHAAGRLTCFGGRRERGETPDECLRRELREELGWQPGVLKKQIELRVGGELIAWFYHGILDVSLDELCLASGFEATLISPADLAAAPLSPWHQAVLRAWFEGATKVDLYDR